MKLVHDCEKLGVTLVWNGKLTISTASKLTKEQLAEIGKHKEEIIEFLIERDNEEVDEAVRIIEARIGPHPSPVAFRL